MRITSYSFYPIDARMYVMIQNQKALIVDPCVSEEAEKYLKENQVEDILVLLTHEHYDHISGVNWLREKFSRVSVLCSESCGKLIIKPNKNLSSFYEILFMGKDEKTQEYVRNMNVQPYSCEADEMFSDELEMEWEGHRLLLKETPGHSKGSICINVDDEILFSGDTLVTGHDTILRLPGGNKKNYYDLTVPYLQQLDKDIMVYPGHGESQKLGYYKEMQ